jgi:hypothetical protein
MPIDDDTYLEFTVFYPDERPGIGHISLCGLCGNSGLIGGGMGLHIKASGRELYMDPRPCICPNGRESIKRGLSLEPDIEALNTPPKEK